MAVLTFESGLKLVYKPKDLGLDMCFANLLARRLRWPLLVVAAFAVKELEIHSPLGDSPAAPAVFVASLWVANRAV